MRAALAAGTVAVALAACSPASDDVAIENATPGEVARKLGDAVGTDAGQWRLSHRFVGLKADGAPQAQVDALTAAMRREGGQVIQLCVTPEQARRPPGDMFAGSAEQNCTYDRLSIADGKLDAMLSCRPVASPNMQLKVAISGDYTARRYDLKTVMTATFGTAGGVLSMKSRVLGERLGPCTARKGT